MVSKVFISYAREDKQHADRLYCDLLKAGVKPWMDSIDLLAGQIWETAISNAIQDSDYFIALSSSRSVRKRGVVQKEIRDAIAAAKRLPEDEIFILVARLDDCEPSFEDLRRLHWTDLFPSYDKGLYDLLRVLKYQTDEKPLLTIIADEKRDGVVSTLSDMAYGFIKYSFIRPNVFFHSRELQGLTFDELRLGDILLFSIAEGPRGRVAVDIERA